MLNLPVKDLPAPLSLRQIIGPSFIILGLGLGSGEIILWPYLVSNYGLGIIWAAVLGISFQFIINMEIERYTLATGESVFAGLGRKLSWIPYWFMISTFTPWIWPGIAASSAKFIGGAFGAQNTETLAVIFLILMGAILTLGPLFAQTLYKTVEKFQKLLIFIGVPSILLLTLLLAKQNHWFDLTKGLLGVGNGYLFLPGGISVASFLAALAYSGTGGNLNLSQSFYVKEKGYGMSVYKEPSKFEPTDEGVRRFNGWWKVINIEHSLIFWFTGAFTILLLALLSYTTTYGLGLKAQGINFVLAEAGFIGQNIFPLAGTFFLMVVGLTLFGTQLTIFDASSRILTENVSLLTLTKMNPTKVYYVVLWLQIMAGIAIFLLGFKEPLQLITIAAVMNAFAMFIHTGLTLWLNLTTLDKPIRPSVFRILAVLSALVFYGGFSIYVLFSNFYPT